MLPSYITLSGWPRSVKTKIEPLEHYFEQHVVWVIHYIYYYKKKHGNGFHVFEDMCESPIPYHTYGLLRILPV